MTPAEIGERIKYYRTAMHLERSDLAAQVGISYMHVYLMEHGRRLPSVPLLCRIAHILGVKLDTLACPDEQAA